jgi:hypothetical protein
MVEKLFACVQITFFIWTHSSFNHFCCYLFTIFYLRDWNCFEDRFLLVCLLYLLSIVLFVFWLIQRHSCVSVIQFSVILNLFLYISNLFIHYLDNGRLTLGSQLVSLTGKNFSHFLSCDFIMLIWSPSFIKLILF